MLSNSTEFCHHRFWTQFCAASSSTIQKRFVEAVLKYAEGAAKQVATREKRGCPSIKDFIVNRQSVSGVEVRTEPIGLCYIEVACTDPFDTSQTLLALVEYSLQIQVPDCAYHHPTLQQLRNSINEIVSWSNVCQPRARAIAPFSIQS